MAGQSGVDARSIRPWVYLNPDRTAGQSKAWVSQSSLTVRIMLSEVGEEAVTCLAWKGKRFPQGKRSPLVFPVGCCPLADLRFAYTQQLTRFRCKYPIFPWLLNTWPTPYRDVSWAVQSVRNMGHEHSCADNVYSVEIISHT